MILWGTLSKISFWCSNLFDDVWSLLLRISENSVYLHLKLQCNVTALIFETCGSSNDKWNRSRFCVYEADIIFKQNNNYVNTNMNHVNFLNSRTNLISPEAMVKSFSAVNNIFIFKCSPYLKSSHFSSNMKRILMNDYSLTWKTFEKVNENFATAKKATWKNWSF